VTLGSLFAGIGGFDLGFERAGFTVRWQVERDAYCTRVLAHHWPHVRRYGDARGVDWTAVEPVDVVCGGFPCQPHALIGRRLGAADPRDLWPEFRRCVRALRPRWVVAENVAGLLSADAGRFFGDLLGDLAASGYDTEWDCLPASAIGANHRRDRVWLLAYRERPGLEGHAGHGDDGDQPRRLDTDAHRPAAARCLRAPGPDAERSGWWDVEPLVGRVAHGVPHRMDRLRTLGNAVVPQLAEWLARRILAAEAP